MFEILEGLIERQPSQTSWANRGIFPSKWESAQQHVHSNFSVVESCEAMINWLLGLVASSLK